MPSEFLSNGMIASRNYSLLSALKEQGSMNVRWAALCSALPCWRSMGTGVSGCPISRARGGRTGTTSCRAAIPAVKLGWLASPFEMCEGLVLLKVKVSGSQAIYGT